MARGEPVRVIRGWRGEPRFSPESGYRYDGLYSVIDAWQEPSRDGPLISRQYDEFLASYKSCKSKPTDPVLSQDIDTVIGSMFQFYRVTRNDIGHPQIVPDLDKGVILANLAQVLTYMERIYGLIHHFRANGVVV